MTPAKEDKKKEEEDAFNEEHYFQKLSIKPGPSKISEAFDHLIKSQSYYPELYEQLYSFVKEVESIGNSKDHGFSLDHPKCNKIFAHFLVHMQNVVCIDFLICQVILIRYLRDCLNSYGWDMMSKIYVVSTDEKKEEYCSKFNGEYIPDICNTFITEYLPKYCYKFDRNLAIKSILFFCDWLHKHKYTTSKLGEL